MEGWQEEPTDAHFIHKCSLKSSQVIAGVTYKLFNWEYV